MNNYKEIIDLVARYFKVFGYDTTCNIDSVIQELDYIVIVKCFEYQPLGNPEAFYLLINKTDKKIYNEMFDELVSLNCDILDYTIEQSKDAYNKIYK